MRKYISRFLVAGALGASMAASAGPIIIGGDDLNDHGSWNGTVNQLGWLYIQNALTNLLPQVTLPGNDGTIVVLGAAPTVPASATPTGSDSCGAAYWPARAIGRTVNCIDGAAAITAYLAGVGSGANRPAVLIYPGDGASNGVDSSEELAIAAAAPTIATFVSDGGGLLAHTGPYTWLTALLPGITISGSCNSSGASLTPAGVAAFPTVTVADITAGPCHNTFGGNIGGLQVLALDGSAQFLILGGGGRTSFVAKPLDVPTLDRGVLLALGLMLVAVVAAGRRKFGLGAK